MIAGGKRTQLTRSSDTQCSQWRPLHPCAHAHTTSLICMCVREGGKVCVCVCTCMCACMYAHQKHEDTSHKLLACPAHALSPRLQLQRVTCSPRPQLQRDRHNPQQSRPHPSSQAGARKAPWGRECAHRSCSCTRAGKGSLSVHKKGSTLVGYRLAGTQLAAQCCCCSCMLATQVPARSKLHACALVCWLAGTHSWQPNTAAVAVCWRHKSQPKASCMLAPWSAGWLAPTAGSPTLPL